MSTDIPEELAPYFTVAQTIVYPISSLSVVFFVYGIYTLLFGTSVYIMHNHQNVEGQNHKLYLFVTITLYALVSLFVIFDAMDMVRETILHFTTIQTGDFLPFVEYLSHDSLKTASYYVFVVSPTLLNIAADTMLIHRCYVIWGRQKLVAIPLIITTTAISIVGFAGSIIVAMGITDSSKESNVALIYLANTIVSANNVAAPILNSILTLLTAGRIWWIHRQVRAQGILMTDNLMSSVTRIIVESGVLYPIGSIIALVFASGSAPLVPFDFTPIPIFAAGIAPTLIIVRAKLGKNVETLQERVSEIRFTSRQAPQEESTLQVHRDSVTFGDLGPRPDDRSKVDVLV